MLESNDCMFVIRILFL